jgi:tripartite-type tricarboxylate transporter receptor subunit TctC
VNERLSASLQSALADPGIAEKLRRAWHRAVARCRRHAAALKAKLESEIARWKPVIETAGVYAD